MGPSSEVQTTSALGGAGASTLALEPAAPHQAGTSPPSSVAPVGASLALAAVHWQRLQTERDRQTRNLRQRLSLPWTRRPSRTRVTWRLHSSRHPLDAPCRNRRWPKVEGTSRPTATQSVCLGGDSRNFASMHPS
jgi:hypothetical protein